MCITMTDVDYYGYDEDNDDDDDGDDDDDDDVNTNNITVEPLTNDHPHQRPSLSYDHTNVILRVVV